MRLIRRFFYLLTKTASEPTFYLELLSMRLRSSFFFFLCVVTLLSLATMLYWRAFTFPTQVAFLQKETAHVFTQIPDSFLLRYREDTLTLEGVPLPFQLTASKEARDLGLPAILLRYNDSQAQNALIHARDKDFSFSPYGDDELGNQTIVYRDVLEEDFTFTKGELHGRMQEWISLLPEFVQTAMIIIFPLYVLFSILSLLILVTVFSSLLHIILIITGIHLPFKKLFQLGLHAGAIAIILDEVQKMIFPSGDTSLFSLAFWGIMTLVLWHLRQRISQARKI